MDALSECPQCHQPLGLELRVCARCGGSAVVTIRLRGPITDPRKRFTLGKQLVELGANFAALKHEFDTAAQPVIARGISRAEAVRYGAVLSIAGVEFTVGSNATTAAPPTRSAALIAAVVSLSVLALGAGVFVLKKPNRSVEAPPPVPVAVIVPEEKPEAKPEAKPVPTRSLEAVTTSVVSIRCSQSLGSGFFISPTEVLTNAHVLCPPGDGMMVVSSSGSRGLGTVVRRDDKLDLALVDVVGLKGEPLEVADATSLHVGDALAMIGSPKGLDFTTHRGNLSFLGRARLGVAYLQVDMAVNPGNSGGPVVNAAGQVVGVMSMMLTNANNIGLALPINYALHGSTPIWPDAPPELRSEAWTVLSERVAKEDSMNASDARDRLSKPGLVKAKWRDETHVLAVVLSRQPTGDERRMTFKLMRGDEMLCEMFQTRTVAWERVDLSSNRVDPQVKNWIESNKLDENLNAGLVELQWSSCHQVFEPTKLELSLVMEDASEAFNKTTLAANPRNAPPRPFVFPPGPRPF